MVISVIVPIYNAENTLKQCIESVLAQTYTKWELLLVDDGSTDHSWDVIRVYEEKDERIKGIRQKKGGPGKARNAGIQAAIGDYAVFLDADDYLDPEYFHLLQPKAEKADVVFVDVFQVDTNGKLLKTERMSRYKQKSKDFFQRAMVTGKAPWGGVRKAVSMDLLKAHHIMYSDLEIGEESLYGFRLFEAAQSIDFIDEKPVYTYVNHEGSQSKLPVADPWGEAVKELKQYLTEDTGRLETFADTFNALNVVATIVSMDRITQLYQGKEQKERIADRMKEYQALTIPSFGIDKRSMMGKARILLPFLKAGMTGPIVFCSKLRGMIRR